MKTKILATLLLATLVCGGIRTTHLISAAAKTLESTTANRVYAKANPAVVMQEGGKFIQHNVAINQGNSGGPLLNDKGEVVGVNTAGFGRNTGNVGLNYAIGVDLVSQFVIDARQGKSSPVATIAQ